MLLISTWQPPRRQNPLPEAPKGTKLPSWVLRGSRAAPKLCYPTKPTCPYKSPSSAQHHEAIGARDPLAVTGDPALSHIPGQGCPLLPQPSATAFPKDTDSQNQPAPSHHPPAGPGAGTGIKRAFHSTKSCRNIHGLSIHRMPHWWPGPRTVSSPSAPQTHAHNRLKCLESHGLGLYSRNKTPVPAWTPALLDPPGEEEEDKEEEEENTHTQSYSSGRGQVGTICPGTPAGPCSTRLLRCLGHDVTEPLSMGVTPNLLPG